MKYEPLKRYLEAADETEVPLSFEQIEQIIGSPLPASARKHAAWWSNSPVGHVNAQAWLQAGYASGQVDLKSGRLVFNRLPADSSIAAGVQESAPPPLKPPGPGFVERLQARLAGTVWIAPGVDLTEPTGEIWNAEIE
jgi:hypothetical protein